MNARFKNEFNSIKNDRKLNGIRYKNVTDPLYENRMQINYNNNNNNSDNNIDNKKRINSIINGSEQKYKLMGKPPIGERQLKNFFGFSLDEREMPITRERSTTHLQVNNNHLQKLNSIDSSQRKLLKTSGSPKQMRISRYDEYAEHNRNRYL